MNLPHLTAVDHASIWEKYGEGMNPNEIAHATGRAYHTVASLIKSHGGIRPPVRTRAGLRLSLTDREEISRGVRTPMPSRSPICVTARVSSRIPPPVLRT